MNAEVNKYINLMRRFATPETKTLLDLRAVLRSRDKKWLGRWFQLGGARDLAMLVQTCPVRDIQLEAVITIYKLSNIRLGMEHFTKHDKLHTLTALVLSLGRLDNKTAVEVLKLLCAVTSEYPETIDSVFAKVNRSRPRFWALVDLLENALSDDVKLWALCAVNSFINAKLALEDRVMTRRFFLDQRIEEILDRHSAHTPHGTHDAHANSRAAMHKSNKAHLLRASAQSCCTST